MAFLLGNESCIESLRSDLSDIQETIDEILVRTGPLKYVEFSLQTNKKRKNAKKAFQERNLHV